MSDRLEAKAREWLLPTREEADQELRSRSLEMISNSVASLELVPDEKKP